MTTVALVDTSGSMAQREGSRRRIDLLADVLQQVLAADPAIRIIAFASIPEELTGAEPGRNLRLPEPCGSTALHLAFERAAQGPRPNRLVVISDGSPDDPQAALAAAKALAPVIIDAYYVGPDDEHAAIGFMRALSFAGGRPGVSGLRSLARPEALAAEIRLRLGRSS
jgi:hypothetical protein